MRNWSQGDHRESHSPRTGWAQRSTMGDLSTRIQSPCEEEHWLIWAKHVKERWAFEWRIMRMLKKGAVFYTERFTLIHSFLETTAVKNNSKYFSHPVSLSYLLDYITNHILNQIEKYQVRRHGSSAN